MPSVSAGRYQKTCLLATGNASLLLFVFRERRKNKKDTRARGSVAKRCQRVFRWFGRAWRRIEALRKNGPQTSTIENTGRARSRPERQRGNAGILDAPQRDSQARLRDARRRGYDWPRRAWRKQGPLGSDARGRSKARLAPQDTAAARTARRGTPRTAWTARVHGSDATCDAAARQSARC